MSYRSEKLEQEKTKKRIRSIAVGVACFVLAVVCLFSAFVPAESWKYYFGLPRVSARVEGELRMHYLDVENGNCVLLELPDGKNVLVGGGADDGGARKNVFRFLNALKIKKIDALVVPNATTNGVGILRELVRFYDVEKAFLPSVSGSNSEYSAFVADLGRKGIPAVTAQSQETIVQTSSDYRLRFLFPLVDDTAVREPVVALSYLGVDVLLGDHYSADVLETLVTEKRLNLWDKWGESIDSFDILQVSDRVDAEVLSEFVDVFGCTTAVFSCRGGEGYTPDEENLTALAQRNVLTRRTDESGFITISVRAEYRYDVFTQK